jgi:hypothetical protein
MHDHQPRDVFVTSWFIFTPLALCFFYFLYQHTVDSADFEFGGILSCVHILFLNYAFYVSYGLFSLVCLI